VTITEVPLLDLTRLDPAIQDELREVFDRVLRSGRYIMGPEVTALEEECASYIGAEHGIAVSSGTDALLASLMALEIGAGDEVVCPTYTFFATAGSIARTGAKPVFVDSDPWTYNWDPDQLERAITGRTKALMPVHLFGQPAEMGRVLEIAAARGIPIIEDAAQAIGVRWNDRGVGSIGSFGCFSFFPSKNLGCLGDGGLVTTNDSELAEKLRIMRMHGGKPKYHHHVVGGNFRMDALQAAMVRVKLRHLEFAHERRRANAALYRRLFAAAGVTVDLGPPERGSAPRIPEGKIGLPVECAKSHIYNQFIIRVPGKGRRDGLRHWLAECRVGTEIYYPVPMHMQNCFKGLGYAAGSFPVAEAAARETLALPIFPDLSEEEIRYVVDRVAAGVAHGAE